MAELLLELFSEEIPARMQKRAADDFKRLVTEGLKEAGLGFDSAEAYVTPRRLALVIDGLPTKQEDVTEERRGPNVQAPEKAQEGFKKSLPEGARVEERETPKGTFFFAIIEKKGGETKDALVGIVYDAIEKMPWPKSMRWGSGRMRWVRPLHSAIALFDGSVLGLDLSGLGQTVSVGDATSGHRFLAPEPFTVSDFADYKQKLLDAKVVLDAAERRAEILKRARKLSEEAGLALNEDEGLADEVAGLVEWPVPLMGTIEPEFMDLPEEVLIDTVKVHQKYFVCRNADGSLADKYIVIANMETADGGKAVVAGNGRVLRARLADAKFYWDTDRAVKLETRVSKLADVVFHAKLGTLFDKVRRLEWLADTLKGLLSDKIKSENVNWGDIDLAARLCKADLTAGVVYEFPDLQGIMGRYYALNDGLSENVGNAIAEHYSPQGPNDVCPTAITSITVSLADKLDTLTTFFLVDELPTGSKDPFALRRAAIGVIRLVTENSLRVSLRTLIREVIDAYYFQYDELKLLAIAKELSAQHENKCFEIPNNAFGILINDRDYPMGRPLDKAEQDDAYELAMARISQMSKLYLEGVEIEQRDVDLLNFIATKQIRIRLESSFEEKINAISNGVSEKLLSFFADRLKVYLKDKGVRHDAIDAVFALGGEDDLVRLLARVDALTNFLSTDDGANLLTAYKRAANILRAEEKKDGKAYDGAPDPKLLTDDAERKLFGVLGLTMATIGTAVEEEDFEKAMGLLAQLRGPVDTFFDDVTVNADDAAIRENRLKLLNLIRKALSGVADFSKIEG